MAYYNNYSEIYNLAKDCLETLRQSFPELKSSRDTMEKVWGKDTYSIPWYAKPYTNQLECEILGTTIDALCLLSCDVSASPDWYVNVYLHPTRRYICVTSTSGYYAQYDLDKPGWELKVKNDLDKLNNELIFKNIF